MKTIEQIDHELEILDAKQGILRLYYEDAANQRLHYEELCESLRGSINQNRNDFNELEQEKKAIIEREKWIGCNQLIESEANRLASSQILSTAANAVIEDYARPESMCVKVAKTLND